MKSLVSIVEGKAKTYKLGEHDVVMGQTIKVKNPYGEDRPDVIVNFAGEHANASKWFCGADGRAYLISSIIEVIPIEKVKKARKMSWDTALDLKDQIRELQHELDEIMMDMEEELAQLGEEAMDGNNPTVVSYAKKVDQINSKIAKIQDRLEKAGYMA